MSKLNLDLFGDSPNVTAAKASDSEKAPDVAVKPLGTPTPEQLKPSTRPSVTSAGSRSPKFVPVGFDSDCLSLLDDAVLALRRRGHWQASKSGIIRALIKFHREDLADVYIRS